MKMEQTKCSETSTYKIQKPGNYPEENIQYTEHGKSLKTSNWIFVVVELFECTLVSVSTEQLQFILTKAILHWLHF
jgi:hypothetical protein